MKNTISKKSTGRSAAQRRSQRKTKKAAVIISPNTLQEDNYQSIPYDEIDISPLNYRKYYSEANLEELGQSLAEHGLLHPVTVRRMDSGRYELVIGERRFRAAGLVGFSKLNVNVKQLTDQQVRVLQLNENLHREDPHPLHEGFGIRDMQQDGQSIEEIATLLGKSKAYVYTRLKLASLIEPMQDVLLAGKMGLTVALEIASLNQASQLEIFEDKCSNWQDDDFRLANLSYTLQRYRYDLTEAPFDTKDKTLLEDVGACSRCPFNSATLKSLFPELAKEAICSNRECFQRKCNAQLYRKINNAIGDFQPEALICAHWADDDVMEAFDTLELTAALPRINYRDVTIWSMSQEPDRSDYTESSIDEEGQMQETFDEEGYQLAMDEYLAEKECFDAEVALHQPKKGVYVNGSEIETVYYEEGRKEQQPSHSTNQTATAKEVQQAIKEGTATVELLQGEIDRQNSREARAQELDRVKVQEKLHERFMEFFSPCENSHSLTEADQVAIRLVIYQSLPYGISHQVHKALFDDKETYKQGTLYQALAELTEAQVAYMVRMVIAGKSESKMPDNPIGYCLYKQAEDAGINVAAIEEEQQQKADERKDRLNIRILELNHRIEKMSQQ